MKPDFALIGPGKVGCAIGRRLVQAGYPISAVIGRDRDRATEACGFIGSGPDIASTDIRCALAARLILIAVPDDRIAATVAALFETGDLSDRVLVHFSGRHQANILRPQGKKAAVLSIHPLLPFADRDMAARKLTECPCALEGDPACLDLGVELVEAFDGRPFHIDSKHKALYHAAACVTSNYLVTLLAVTEQLAEHCGIEKNDVLPLFLPLARATLDNVDALGTGRGLTGPIARGDAKTVSGHFAALQQTAPDSLDIYKVLAQQTLELARQSERIDATAGERIRTILNKHG